jgi:NAD(P)-dependent dehydrogenase (short-subunit alcohol dehydrogenase family)
MKEDILMAKSIFITGTSTGLGKQTALHFAKLGWNVAATMRTPENEMELMEYANVKVIKHDVTNVEGTKAAVAEAIRTFGGMGSYGALELAQEETIDWQYAVNVRGPINVIRAFLPHFRENGGGKFINISSFMGVTTAVPIGSLYNMSKFALEGLTEGLYYELKPLGIDLHLIEQGGSSGNNFQNNIIWNSAPDITAYDEITDKVRNHMKSAISAGLDDPQTIVDAIAAVATGESGQFRTPVGDAAHQLIAMRASMPIEEYLEAMAANYR